MKIMKVMVVRWGGMDFIKASGIINDTMPIIIKVYPKKGHTPERCYLYCKKENGDLIRDKVKEWSCFDQESNLVWVHAKDKLKNVLKVLRNIFDFRLCKEKILLGKTSSQGIDDAIKKYTIILYVRRCSILSKDQYIFFAQDSKLIELLWKKGGTEFNFYGRYRGAYWTEGLESAIKNIGKWLKAEVQVQDLTQNFV